MTEIFRTRGAARVGLATLALALQVAMPLAQVSLAQSTGSPAPAMGSAQPTSSASTASGCHDTGPADYPVAGGWFYTQQARGLCIQGNGPDRNRGYLVVDDDKGAFWTEFRRYGGVDVLGYPVSQPYHYPPSSDGGYWYQAFERGILQWRPEAGRADMANVFDQFTEQGLDDDLAVLGIPGPRPADKSSLAAEINERMNWITEPRFLARFFYDPVAPHSSDPDRQAQTSFGIQEQAWQFFGLPQSMPERVALLGPAKHMPPDDHIERVSLYPLVCSFMAQRFQKAGMQLFFEDTPQEKYTAPAWDDVSLRFDPTVVPGDAKKGCLALTAVGLLARSIGADKVIPSMALEPRPLDPSPRPSLESFVPAVAQGQLMTSFQLVGTGFAGDEPLTITLTDTRSNPTGGQLPTVVNHVSATYRDGSFDAVMSARVGTYQITVVGDTSHDTYMDVLDLTTPSGIYVLGGRTGTCGSVGLPVAAN
jgi:hypothetical protein